MSGTEAPIDLAARLATPLMAVRITSRLLNWAESHGLETLGDLARFAPEELLAETNLGRTSIAQARSIIERVTQRRWEDLLPEPPPERPVEIEETEWDAMRARLTAEQRAIAVADLDLTSRLANHCNASGMTTLGDLAAHSTETMMEGPFVGRRSVDDLCAIVADHFAATEADDVLARAGLFQAFEESVQALEPVARTILRARSGLDGDVTLLRVVGSKLGLSRERVRQIQSDVCRQMGKRRWARDARERAIAAMDLANGAVPLADLARDPWWSGAIERPAVVRFVLEYVALAPSVYIIEIGEVVCMSPRPPEDIVAAEEGLLEAVTSVPVPAPRAALEHLVRAHAAGLGDPVETRFRAVVGGLLHIDDADPSRVVAVGSDRRAAALALLRAAGRPLRLDEIERRLGVRLDPREYVLRLGRGIVALPEHIADYETWRSVLAPDCARIIREHGPERQWSCDELLELLSATRDLPSWVDAYGLAALIKDHGAVAYLGRRRVGLPERGRARTFVRDAVLYFLERAGKPVAKNEVIDAVRLDLGAAAPTLEALLKLPPVVFVDDVRIGLAHRDVAGGSSAIARACDLVDELFAAGERWLPVEEVHAEVASLSRDHAEWSAPLLRSILRHDPRFRIARRGDVIERR